MSKKEGVSDKNIETRRRKYVERGGPYAEAEKCGIYIRILKLDKSRV